MNFKEIIKELNEVGEHDQHEAKTHKDDSLRSLMETVCSFSNEPGAGGGIIVLGVMEETLPSGSKKYVVEGVDALVSNHPAQSYKVVRKKKSRK